MANEFIARKGLISSGSINVSGSITASGFFGTASIANKVVGGTQLYVPLWSTSSTLSSSLLFQTGSSILLGATTQHTPTAPDRFGVFAGVTDSYNLISAHGEIDSYLQLNIKNFSTAATASSDIVATADTGDELGGFIDFGINSSTYGLVDGIGGPLDAYLYSTGSDLLIGNTTPDKRIILFTGGGNAANNARVYIDATGSVGINTSQPTTGNPEALVVQALTNSYNLITAKATLDNYAQINIKNLSGGTTASADIVATNNTGNETTNYIDMGINSDQYNQPGLVGGPNDAYMYSTGNMLHIGNATPGQHIMFFAGGIDAEANNKLTLDANNQHSLSGSLNVTGSVNVLDNVINNLTASHAMTASYVAGAVSDWNTLQNKPEGLVSNSAQYPGWVTASSQIQLNAITGTSFSNSAFYFPNNLRVDGTLTAQEINTEYVSSSVIYESGSSKFGDTNDDVMSVTGSIRVLGGNISGSFIGLLSESTQVNYTQLQNIPVDIVSSSTQVKKFLPIGTVSESLQYPGWVTASSQIDYNLIQNKLSGAISSSTQFNALSNTSSSFATSASYAPFILPNGIFSSSLQVDYNQIQNQPTTIETASYVEFGNIANKPILISSSLQINTGSFSGSITTASFATTASYAPTILPNGLFSSSLQVDYTDIQNKPTTIETASYVQFSNIANKPTLISSSTQFTNITEPFTGSFTGSFTGEFIGTASFSTTASYVLPSGLPSGSVSSSAQINYTQIQNKPTTIETASYVEFVNVVNKPELISSSQQINTGSFTGSFTGNIFGDTVSASVLYVNGNITQPSQSSHTASLNYLEIPATSAKVALSTRGKILYSNFFSNTGSLPDPSLYHGMFTHVHSEGAAYYSHGSNGWVKLWDQFNVPVLVSASLQFNPTSSFSGSFSGSFTGNGSGLTNIIPDGTISSSAQVTASINGAIITPAEVSGSTIHADIVMAHKWLELYPTSETITPDPDSAYFYISGSNNDLWYTHKTDSTVNFDWIEGALETGLLHGGIAGFNGSDVYIRSGSGIIVTHGATTGSAPSPTINYVKWPVITGSIDVTNGFVTYLAINANGILESSSTKFSSLDYHDKIPLGAVGHFNNVAIVAKGEQVNTQYSQIAQITDFARNFGPIKVSGYGITAQSGSLKFTRAAGNAFIYGGFYSQNPETPSNFQSTAVNTGSLAYIYRSGSGYDVDANNNNFYTEIKPGFYDDNSGTPAALASNEWSIQRVFIEPVTGIHYIYYGQTKYTSLANALTNLTTDTFAEGPATTLFTVFIGYIIAKGNTTNLLDTTENNIVNAGLFRNTSAGSVGGGAAAQLLNDLSDVTVTAPTNGEALIYSSGNWINGVPSNAVSASFATTSSFATSASYAPAAPVSFNDITNKPALVSSSLQFTNPAEPFTGSFSGSFSGDGSNVTGVISASYASNTSNTGRKIVNSIPFIVGERLELQNIGAGVDEIDTGLRTEVNLTNVDLIQVSARVERGTGSDSELRVQYSTDENTWNNLTTVTGVNAGARVDLLTAGTILTSELAIASGAKTTVILRLVTTSGTGLSAQLGNVVLHTIYQL